MKLPCSSTNHLILQRYFNQWNISIDILSVIKSNFSKDLLSPFPFPQKHYVLSIENPKYHVLKHIENGNFLIENFVLIFFFGRKNILFSLYSESRKSFHHHTKIAAISTKCPLILYVPYVFLRTKIWLPSLTKELRSRVWELFFEFLSWLSWLKCRNDKKFRTNFLYNFYNCELCS